MKKLFQLFLLTVLLSFGVPKAFSCECIVTKLEKRFHDAKAVFIGRVASYEEIPSDNNLIQGDGAQTLLVTKSWKGVKRKFIDVNFDLESAKNGGMCPTLLQLAEGKEYLIFAYGKEYTINTVCSDTRQLDKTSPYYEYQQKQIKKLNSFWFRLMAGLNPF